MGGKDARRLSKKALSVKRVDIGGDKSNNIFVALYKKFCKQYTVNVSKVYTGFYGGRLNWRKRETNGWF